MEENSQEEVYRRQLRHSHAHVGLSDHERAEEEFYRRQLREKWSRRVGDPLLKSVDSDGTPVKGSFGRRIDGDEEVELHDD
jgi:hypothetical protein